MKSRPAYRLKDICEENSYEISVHDFDNKQRIGNGAFGEVFTARCKLNDCRYALKVLNKDFVQTCGCERHIMREKEILNSMDHPNILRLESYFHDSENCYFLTELCEVGDLNSFIREHKKLSSKLTREFTMEIVLALEYLRKLNIVHRDLKPQNILLDDTFHLKVTDFGTAKRIDPEEVSKLIRTKTFNEDDDLVSLNSEDMVSVDNEVMPYNVPLSRTNTQIGSPLYMSPEMLMYQIASFSTDLWSLG